MRKSLFAAALLTACISAFAQSPRAAAPAPENLVLTKGPYMQNIGFEGRSYNFGPTFFIYPDSKLDNAGAEALLNELGLQSILEDNHGAAMVINPVGAKYDSSADFDSFVAMYNRARSGNLKIIGIGEGATFVNAVIAPKACGAIAGILTVGGKAASKSAYKGDFPGVPSYVAGKTAKKVSEEYKALNAAHQADEELLKVVVNNDSKASLSELFAAAWDEVFSTCYRFNNYKHTQYEGMTFNQYGTNELEPYIMEGRWDIERKVVTMEQRNALPYLWYEYWPKELMEGAADKSVPVMVLLHGNTNDPRTQAETSGFIEVAAKERFFVVEIEWQGSATAAVLGHDGVESVLYHLFDKYPQLDPSRVYAEGLSAGSMTATALGIKKSHVFTAVGGHSGGVFGGNSIGGYSSYTALYREATQKRDLVEMPYCSVGGTADNVVPWAKPENWKTNGYYNAWRIYEQINGIPVIEELDFSVDSTFGFKLMDRETVVTTKGDGISMEVGNLYKGNMPIIRFIAVNDYGHWNFKPTAQMMWDFFKHYSRDPKTGKLSYTE